MYKILLYEIIIIFVLFYLYVFIFVVICNYEKLFVLFGVVWNKVSFNRRFIINNGFLLGDLYDKGILFKVFYLFFS